MRDFLKAAARLVLGIAVLVGVPAALCIAVGWPLPRSIPSWAEIRDEFDRQGVPIDAAIRVLAVIVWCAWAQLAVAVLIELAATVRGRASRRPPLLPATQTLARQFVASATLILSMIGAGRSGGPAVASAAPLAVIEVSPNLPSAIPTPSAGEAATMPSAPAVPPGEYVVQPGDSYWGLAETHLGDGARWSEIRDANIGRTVDGRRVITALDDDLHPGWHILLPVAATPVAVPPPAAPAVEVQVTPGDHFWRLAETRLADEWGRPVTHAEVRAYWNVLVEANRDRLAPPGDPNLIHPGEVFVAPDPGPDPAEPPQPHRGTDEAPDSPDGDGTEVGAAAPVPDPTIAPSPAGGNDRDPNGLAEPGAERSAEPESGADEIETPPPPATSSHTTADEADAPTADATAASRDGEDEESEGSTAPVVPVLGVAGTALAVAVLRELRRRRRLRAARLPIGVVPAGPPRSTRPAAEQVLAANEEPVDALDAALASLCAGLNPRGGERCIQPKVLQVTGRRVEVLLDRPDPSPPAPWRPEASGRVWVLDDSAELAVPDAASPLPALVTIGVDDAELLVDLEAFGVVTLSGDPENCWAMARSMVTELAAKADSALGIELVGVLEGRLEDLDGVRRVGSWEEVDTGVIAGSARMLDAGRWPHTFAARASGRVFDGWAPAVWVTAPSDSGRYQDAIEQVASRPGSGSAIVVVAGDVDEPPGRGVHIVIDPDGAFHVPELGLAGRAQLLDAEPADQIVELLDDAAHTTYAQTIDFPRLDLADDPLVVEDAIAVVGPDDDGTPPLDQAVDGPGGSDALDKLEGDHVADPSDPCPPVARRLAPDSDRYEDPPWRVLVRVCGEVAVEGGKTALAGPEAAAATYVALHREADVDQIRDAIWGGRDVSRKRVRNVLANMRQALGDEMFYVSEGRLAASEQCLTDHELIRRRLAYARHQTDPAAKVETLRGALEWVTGKVCSYPSRSRRTWSWIDFDNWIPTVESTVGAVAHDLATLYLELDDADGATWAARRGIDATGPREQLTVLLVRGYATAGDDPAAAAALRAYERYMEDLGGADHSEELLELLDRYLPTGRARAS